MHGLTGVVTAIEAIGAWGVFWGMLLESCYIPLPSEVILPYAGFLVASGRTSFLMAVIAAMAGSMVGALLSYAIARYGGRPLLERYGRYVGLRAREIDKAEHWFQRYGDGAVFFGRLLPGIRTYISLPAGVAEMGVGRFLGFSFLGALPWTLLFIWAGRALGANWQHAGGYTRDFAAIAVLVTVIWLAVMLWRRRRSF